MSQTNTAILSTLPIETDQIGSSSDDAICFDLDGYRDYKNLAAFSFCLNNGEVCLACLSIAGNTFIDDASTSKKVTSKAEYLSAVGSEALKITSAAWLETEFFIQGADKDALNYASNIFNGEMHQYFQSIQEAVEYFFDDEKMKELVALIESSIAMYQHTEAA